MNYKPKKPKNSATIPSIIQATSAHRNLVKALLSEIPYKSKNLIVYKSEKPEYKGCSVVVCHGTGVVIHPDGSKTCLFLEEKIAAEKAIKWFPMSKEMLETFELTAFNLDDFYVIIDALACCKAAKKVMSAHDYNEFKWGFNNTSIACYKAAIKNLSKKSVR